MRSTLEKKKVGVLSAGTGDNEAEVGAGYFNGDVHGLIQL